MGSVKCVEDVCFKWRVTSRITDIREVDEVVCGQMGAKLWPDVSRDEGVERRVSSVGDVGREAGVR